MKLHFYFCLVILLICLTSVRSASKTFYVTPNRTCGRSCIGDIINPFDNILFALRAANSTKTSIEIVLLGNSSAQHYILPRELNRTGSNLLLYDFTSRVKFQLEDVEIRPLFCDETIVKTNSSLLTRCVNKTQSVTLVFKPMDLAIVIANKLWIQNIVFDWTESSQSLNSSLACAQNRTRCCNTNTSLGIMQCDPKYYTKQPASKSNTYNFIELDSKSSITKSLLFDSITLKNFRDKTIRSFLETNGNFDLVFQNSKIEDVTFGRGLVGHVGLQTLNSTLKFINVNYSKYNYWNREEDLTFNTWREGYLLYADTIFNASLSIINSSFIDMNTASMYRCEITYKGSNQFRTVLTSKTNIWDRYNGRSSSRDSSLIFIRRLNGDLNIKGSTFQKIIGLFGSVIQIPGTSDNASFIFQDNKFDDNFAMQAFANIIIATEAKPSTEPVKCPSVRVENCEFTNTKACPGSYGNVGYICYWDTIPSNTSYLFNFSSVYLAYQANRESLFGNPQVRISNSKFQNNLITLSNSLVIIGSFFTSLNNNIFQDNGGTTAELILYSLNNSNFLDKKPNQSTTSQSDWKSYYSSNFFGQSSALYIDRLFRLESTKNIFQRNWGPWEASQALGSAVTVRSWIPFRSGFLKFKDDIFRDNWGIPLDAAKYLTNYGSSLKNNSYMPPLIAISFDPQDASRFYEKVQESYISLDEVEFVNNTLSFDVEEGCKYNSYEIELVCSIMKNKNRYLTGLVKFVAEPELTEESYVSFVALNQKAEISFSMVNSRIINNTLLTQGCFFSTLWVENYLLHNLTIQGNKIHPFSNSFNQSGEYSEPFLDLALENRAGMFCGFKRETINGFRNGILFTAERLKVFNNLGTIFNLYPLESNNFYLSNSIFVNNSVPYGSMINIFETSKVTSKNNIFNENDNALGTFFSTTINASHSSIFNIYIKNNGKHASLSYINDKSQTIEVLAKSYWNSIKPDFLTFNDEITPQGGLYYLESAQIIVMSMEFKQNYVYAGLIISQRSVVSFDIANISDHYITGSSVLGNFYSSNLNMRQLKILNNTLTYLPSLDSVAAIIMLDKVNINGENLEVSETLSPNQGDFLIGTNVQGTINNIKFENFYASDRGSLIRLDHSSLKIENLNCNNISSFLKLSNTYLTLRNAFIQNLRVSTGSHFLINSMDTTLNIIQLKYLGGYEAGNYFSLITGSDNNIKMIYAEFIDALNGLNKLFDLKESSSVLVARSKFFYTNSYTQTIIFELSSSNLVDIRDCIFISPGQVIQANSILTGFYFLRNTILTNSLKQSIQIVESNKTDIIQNIFVHQGIKQEKVFPESQVYFLDSFGITSIKDNCFISLYGSKGIINIQAFANPYYLNISENILVDNIGSNGGALHLVASLSSLSNEIPTAIIYNSIFMLNKAIVMEGLKGKGGAIFQTTSTSTKQSTIIKNVFFIKNFAETIGGALFFDYLPFEVDVKTLFKDNYANRLNHIGSYPVKLSYFEKQPQETKPYVPNQSFLEQSPLLEPQDFTIWKDLPSGIKVHKTYIFGLVDMFGQIVYDDNSSTLELYPEGFSKETRHLFSSILSVNAKNGIYNLSNFIFSHKVDDYYYVSFISSAIQDQRQIPLDTPINSASSLKVQIHFRKCGRGESVLKEEETTVCGECHSGFWQTSPIPNALACKPCDDTSIICLGGDRVGPKKGYWRLNESADIVLLCPIKSSCLGNEITDQKESTLLDPKGKCDYGYTGNLCSNCIPGWAKTASGSCTLCQKDAWFYVRVAATLIGQFVFIIYGFKETMNLCKDYSKDKILKLNGAILIRILTNYLQLTSLVSAIPVTWPSLIKSIFQVTLEILSVNRNTFTVDCILNSEELFGIKVLYIKLLIETIGGLVLASLSIFFWILRYLIKKKQIFGNKNFKNNVIATVIVICFMMQPSAIQSSLSFFQCTNLYREDTPIRYFSKDYDVKCWEGEHLYWTVGLGLPSLIIWVFVLPFTVFNQIRKNKDKLTTQEISQKYSFLYGGYSHQKYYWEVVIMMRKLVFICVIIGASFYSVNLEIYMSILLTSIFSFIHSISYPFSDPKMNSLERLSLTSAITINFCGLYFQFFPSAPLPLYFIVIGIGLLANLVFLVAFVKFYFVIQITKLKENPNIYHKISRILRPSWSRYFNRLSSNKISEKATIQTDLDPQDKIKQTTTFYSYETRSEAPLKKNALLLSKQIFRNQQGIRECSIFDNISTNRPIYDNFENGSIILHDDIEKINQNMAANALQSICSSESEEKRANKLFSLPIEKVESTTNLDDLTSNQKNSDYIRESPSKSQHHNFQKKSNNSKSRKISSTNTV